MENGDCNYFSGVLAGHILAHARACVGPVDCAGAVKEGILSVQCATLKFQRDFHFVARKDRSPQESALDQPNAFARVDYVLATALALLTLAVYAQVGGHGFTNYDDDLYVTANPEVLKGLSASSIAYAFTGPHGGNWHPLTSLSHMVDVQVFGLAPGAHHIVNLLFHLANALLVFYWVRTFLGARWPSFFVAAFFALHPTHVESVAWISSRKDVLSAFFWLLTLIAYGRYVQRDSRRAYIFVCVFQALALMSKPMAVTIPFTLLLLDFWPLRRPLSAKVILDKLPLVGLCILQGLATLWAQSAAGAMSNFDRIPVTARIVNALLAYALYLVKAVVPTGLIPFYPHMGFDTPEPLALGVAIFLLAITAVALLLAKRAPAFAMGWFWFGITLLPAIGLIQVGSQGMADRYTYIPYIGLSIALAWTVWTVIENSPVMQRVAGGIAAVFLIVLVILTARQASHWKSSVTLWQHAVAVDPTVARNQKSLGSALKTAGNRDRAIAAITEALRLQPGLQGANNNLGILYLEQGDAPRALELFAAELANYPTDVKALTGMGNALWSLKRPGEARAAYQKALDQDPVFEDAINGLGLAALAEGKPDEAEREFQRCLQLNPRSAGALTNIASIRLAEGKRAEALALCEKALQANPQYVLAQRMYKHLTGSQ